MVAVVDAGDPVPAETIAPGNLSSGSDEICEVVGCDAEAAKGVADDIDIDAGTGALGKGLHIAPADLPTVEYIGFEIYVLLSRADGRQLSLVETIAVGKNLETGMPVGLGVGKGLQ